MNILLSTDLKNYKNAVISAGAKTAKNNCDGLILTGGGDIDPSFYNEKNTASENIDYNKDLYEFNLLKQFVNLKKPVLGICRGMQIINVFFGGTLYQDIENHKAESGDIYHTIAYNNKEFLVNSCHHQAIKKAGEGIIVTARAADGIIEAVRHSTLNIFGVQFHPERMAKWHNVFDFFIDICAR